MAKWTKNEIVEAIASLKEELKPGDTIYTQVKSVARSGMSRTISCYIIRDNEPRWISRLVAKATDSGYDDDKEAVKVSGCGSDMGFQLVYHLSRVLFPYGFKVDGRGRNGDMSGHDSDGGYALKQRWL